MKIICEECKAEFETCDCFDRHGRKVIENLKKELAEMTSSRDFYKEENQSFGNVLAVIHRDGGHYITEHGHVKASRDAIKILYDKQKELAEAKKEIERLKSLPDCWKFGNDGQTYTLNPDTQSGLPMIPAESDVEKAIKSPLRGETGFNDDIKGE